MLANNEMATELDVQDALCEVQAVLEKNGYQYQESDFSVIVLLGDPSNPLPAVITVAEGQLSITCQLTTLGVIGEDQLIQFLVAALDLNTQILPFATALISDDEGESHDWPVVLMDSIPTCDLQESELVAALDSLATALPLAADLIGAFEAQSGVPC